MYTHKIGFISLSIIGVAAVLMVVTAPTFENQQSASRWLRKLVWKILLPKLRKILLGKDSAVRYGAGSVAFAGYQYISGDRYLDIQELDHQ